MGFFELMIKKDDYIISFAESIRAIKNGINPTIRRVDREMKKRPIEGKGHDLYILLNAPSLKTQDISVLKGKNTMFVNRGFMHPSYKDLQPKYHVFIDSKMLNGTWPVSWLEEIWTMSPNTTIILPISWYCNDIFSKYRNDKRIFWFKHSLPFYSLGVSGGCFSFAIQQKFEKIYFAGFDATGIGHEMVKTADSHFYGNDKELDNKSTTQFVIDLYMHSRHLHDLNRLAIYCRKKGIVMINMTNGGLLDMFPRDNSILPILQK
nr:hypothetical protein [uncultured Bacteroides sp.]